jgi:sugar (pentulose or hexulose) kinase
MNGYLLGVDAGHTVTKAAIFDTRGRSVGNAARTTHTITRHPHWQERDMDELWESTAAAITDALADAGISPAEVLGVGISAHGDGLYLVNAVGRPVRAAILATDTRRCRLLRPLDRHRRRGETPAAGRATARRLRPTGDPVLAAGQRTRRATSNPISTALQGLAPLPNDRGDRHRPD